MSEAEVAARIEALADGEGPALGPFARELRTGQGRATSFLDPMPASAGEWVMRIAEAAARGPIPRTLAARLVERQRALGAGERAVANAQALAEPGTVAVVTGQQPGLFGGPLLTAHKVAGTINLARALDSVSEHRVVPVFWSASEDHDFDEANRAVVIGRDGQPVMLKVDAEGDGRSISDLDVPDVALERVGDELAGALPDTERGRAAAALARPREGEDFATASVSALLRLFGDAGLVVVEPEQLWPDSGETLATLLEEASSLRSGIRKIGSALDDAGLPAPLDPGESHTPIFYRAERGGPRLRVDVDGTGNVLLRGAPVDLTAAELAEHVRAHPEQASGNVAGRVFVQNAHLPVLAYIAGPTEIAYQAQLRGAAATLGWPFPLALPRPEVTWVDARAARAASELGIGIGAVLRGETPAFDVDDGVRDTLDAAAAELAESSALDALEARGGRVGSAAEQARKRLAQAFDRERARIEKAAQNESGVGRGRFERLRSRVLPFGRPQERTLSPWNFVARYGIEAVRAGLFALDPLVPAHLLVHVGENG